jgi:hypothetical protein
MIGNALLLTRDRRGSPLIGTSGHSPVAQMKLCKSGYVSCFLRQSSQFSPSSNAMLHLHFRFGAETFTPTALPSICNL